MLSGLVCSGRSHPLPTACAAVCITGHERTYLRRMINRCYADGREVSSACGVHRYEQTRIKTSSQDVRFPAAYDQCSPPLYCLSRPISRGLQRRSQALAPDPEVIPLNKHPPQSVSPKCATLCVLYSVLRVISSRSHASGECIRYMSTCDGCGTWTGELSLLARGGGQGSSQLYEGGGPSI
jgi:hypothetical protein